MMSCYCIFNKGVEMRYKIAILLTGIILMSCIACSNEDVNHAAESNNTQSDTQVSTQIEDKDDEIEKEFDYRKLSDDMLVDDEDMKAKVSELISEETKFINKLDTEWPNNETIYEMNGGQYLLVEEAENWVYYEDLARNYYAESYIKEIFNPWYTDDGRIFLEKDGKLYRSMSDGIGSVIINDSIKLWQMEENLYYVTMLFESDAEEDIRGFILRNAPDKKYGFEIIEKADRVTDKGE